MTAELNPWIEANLDQIMQMNPYQLGTRRCMVPGCELTKTTNRLCKQHLQLARRRYDPKYRERFLEWQRRSTAARRAAAKTLPLTSVEPEHPGATADPPEHHRPNERLTR